MEFTHITLRDDVWHPVCGRVLCAVLGSMEFTHITLPGAGGAMMCGTPRLSRYDAFMREWPEWWKYELVLSPHLIERMRERRFSELDLRTMLNEAEGYHPSVVSSRFLIRTHHARQMWEIVVEPDELERTLVVITAYGVE